jgi:hypothetical protein
MSKRSQPSPKPDRQAYLAQVLILLDGPSHDEACDALSDLLTHFGIYGERTGILDWSYRDDGGVYDHPNPVRIPVDFEPDALDLNQLARGKGGAS